MSPPRAFGSLRTLCATCAKRQIHPRAFSTASRCQDPSESNLPRVAQTTFWASLIPTSLRSRSSAAPSTKAARPWNPMTIFIFLGILVGSNAIQIIALRNEMLNFSRKTEAKLSLLREVVQRVKDGEEVDVKALLGTGNPKSEAEWEEMMKELEETDMLAEGRRKREEKRKEKSRQREESEVERRREREDGATRGGDGAEKEGGGRPRFMM